LTNARYFATTLAVNHLRLVALSILLAACEKPNDIPRMQDEALALAKSYQDRFDDLAHRAQAIHPERLTSLDAQRAYQQASSRLIRSRNDLRQVPLAVQAGVKSGPEELQKLIDSMRERFEGAVIQANDELDAVESAVALAEQHPAGAPAPTPAPEPVTGDPQSGDPSPAADPSPPDPAASIR
jgi:hypothetical protein